jgi:copper(I)-binding protein
MGIIPKMNPQVNHLKHRAFSRVCTAQLARYRRPAALAGVLMLSFAAVACGSNDAGTTASDTAVETTVVTSAEGTLAALEILDPWVREPAMGQTVAAGYMTIVNNSDSDLQLVAASTPVARTELHETIADGDGVMRMQHRPDGFAIPAGGELVLEPGGNHLMMMDIDRLAMSTAGEVTFMLDFGSAGVLPVVAPIRSMDGEMMHGDMDGGEHGDMHGDMHGDDHDEMHEKMHGDDASGTMVPVGTGPLPDAHLLHTVDDELHAGTLDPSRQLQMINTYRQQLLVAKLPNNFDLEAMLVVLAKMEAAIVAGNTSAAAALAFEAHDLAHSISPHHH